MMNDELMALVNEYQEKIDNAKYFFPNEYYEEGFQELCRVELAEIVIEKSDISSIIRKLKF